MRIVFVISNLRWGGAEIQAIGLARALCQRGHAVAIYTLGRHNPRADELEGSGVQLVADQKRFKLDPLVILRLRRFLRHFRADIVHGFLYDGDFYSRVAASGTGIPALNSERSDNYQLKPLQQVGLWLTRHLAAGLVANTHAGARFAGKLFRLPPERLHVVWNAIDLAAVDDRCRASDRDYRREFFSYPDIKMATLVGNITPTKDHLLALELADYLTRAHASWRVLFVGEQMTDTGGYKSRVMQRFHSLGLSGRAAFVGLRRDVVEIMHQSDVVFSTSRHEGFPNVVLEAMAAGAPVITTAYSDIRLILPEPWQVVEERAVEPLATAILRADAAHETLKAAQRSWVAQHAMMDAAAQRLESVYQVYVRHAAVVAPAQVNRH
ncbi:MAG: glycosyltransferase [Acidiferrobacteraceae bacterium]